MRRLQLLFLALLSFVDSLSPFQRIARWIERKDPLDNVGLWLSPWKRRWHQYGLQLCTVLAAVAVTALPGQAMPVFNSAGAVRWWATASAGLATVGATAQRRQKLPFRYGTVRRRINIANLPVTLGGQIPSQVIPQVGMLANILFDIEGSYTVATAPLVVLNTDGFDSLLARTTVTLNNGSANLVDLSGIGVNVINKNLNTSLPIKRGSPAGVGNVNGTQFPLALGASTFTYKGVLPICANGRRQFEMGLINLQAPELRANINMSFNPASVLVTTPANLTVFSATVNLSYEYYEIPDLRVYDLPPLTLVRSIEEAAIPIAATGQQIYQIPRLGTMIEYHAVLIFNLLYGSMNNSVTEFDIRYNKTDQQYQVFVGDWETYEALLYGFGIDVLQAPTPTAATPTSRWQCFTPAVTFNLWAAGDTTINGGDFRDAIDTEENTTTETITTIKSSQVLTAGKDNLFHVRRVVQRIVPAPAPAQAA